MSQKFTGKILNFPSHQCQMTETINGKQNTIEWTNWFVLIDTQTKPFLLPGPAVKAITGWPIGAEIEITQEADGTCSNFHFVV